MRQITSLDAGCVHGALLALKAICDDVRYLNEDKKADVRIFEGIVLLALTL